MLNYQNPTQTGLETNVGLHDENLASNCISHGTAFKYGSFKLILQGHVQTLKLSFAC